MNITATLEKTRYDVFRWRSQQLSITGKIILALSMAVITGLLAQLRIYLPWSPVPITAQTFAVLLAGVLLGKWWGGISLAVYTGLGAAGVPWFNGWNAGLSHLVGPTGGYLIGFVLAAFFLGYFSDKYVKSRGFLSMLGLMSLANFVFIYIPGAIQLGLWLKLVENSAVTATAIISMGVLPFIAGDIAKIILAASVAKVITPKLDFKRM